MTTRWRSRLAVSVAVACGVVLGAQPALAAPSVPTDAREDQAAPATEAWEPDAKLPEPRTIPGTGTRIAPGTSALAPTAPKALPGLENAKASALKPGTDVRRVAQKDVKQVEAAEPEGPYYCEEYISGSTNLGETIAAGPYSDTRYVAELYCNFYLDYAYGVSYAVDRSNGYHGEIGYVGEQFEFVSGYYGASRGAFRVEGDLYDGGRQVEILFELYLLAPGTWGACNPLPTLRYLLCEGVGTNLLHIVVGTGTFGTGLAAPVIRYAALGDSFSAGTGASTEISDGTPCRRSTQTYPYRLAGGSLPLGQRGERLRIDQPNLRACLGAQIPDILNPQVPGEGRQLDAVNPNRTRLVTLTIGGNDLGFTPNLRNCALSNCGGAPLIAPADVQRTQVALTSLYRVIRGQMRQDGRLIVASYPAFLPNPDDSADAEPTIPRCPEVNLRIDTQELRRIYEAAVQIRDMIQAAVAATGDPNVVFVDLLEAFRGQRACSATPMANDINITDLTSSFHPNDRGYQRMSDRITVAVGIGL